MLENNSDTQHYDICVNWLDIHSIYKSISAGTAEASEDSNNDDFNVY